MPLVEQELPTRPYHRIHPSFLVGLTNCSIFSFLCSVLCAIDYCVCVFFFFFFGHGFIYTSPNLRMPLVEQELPTRPYHLNSSSVCGGARELLYL